MAENALFSTASAHPGVFEAYTIRPCFIYQENPNMMARVLTSFHSMTCHVEELAAAMLEVAKNGYKETIIGKDEIRGIAQQLSSTSKGVENSKGRS